MRDKILSGEIEWEDCDHKDVYNFLKLLKQPSNYNQTNVILIMTEEEWKEAVEKSKKRSTLSIFSV